MESWWKTSFSKKTQKHVFCALSLNISYKIHFFFGEKILVALDTYAKKMNLPSIVFLGGVHGKSCWLIAYNIMFVCEHWLKSPELYEVQSTFGKQGKWSNLKSSIPADAVLQGRPYGGTGFICKTIQHCNVHDVPQEDGKIYVVIATPLRLSLVHFDFV